MLLTENPYSDAERWANEQDRKEQAFKDRQAKARNVVLAALSMPAAQWRKGTETGGLFISPDELLYEAIEAEDPEVLELYDELMSSASAQKLREALADHHGDKAPYLGD